jgi:glycosidase
MQLFSGKNGSMAAFITTALMKGVPLIYNGQEVGTTAPIVYPFNNMQIDWTQNADVLRNTRKLFLSETIMRL